MLIVPQAISNIFPGWIEKKTEIVSFLLLFVGTVVLRIALFLYCLLVWPSYIKRPPTYKTISVNLIYWEKEKKKLKEFSILAALNYWAPTSSNTLRKMLWTCFRKTLHHILHVNADCSFLWTLYTNIFENKFLQRSKLYFVHTTSSKGCSPGQS